MSKTTIVIIVYILGLIFGALFLDLWSADTNIIKGLIGLGWTALLLIGLYRSYRLLETKGASTRDKSRSSPG